MNSYNIGQVLYAIPKKGMTVQPYQVIEIITKKNLQGESMSYVLRTFFDSKEVTEIDSKIDAEFFASAEIAQTTLTSRAAASIEKIIESATLNAKKYFSLIEERCEEPVTHNAFEQNDSSTVETIIEGKRVKVRLPKT